MLLNQLVLEQYPAAAASLDGLDDPDAVEAELDEGGDPFAVVPRSLRKGDANGSRT